MVGTSTNLLSLSSLSKRFGKPSEPWAVRRANLEVAAGQIVGLVGPNGAGKTTSLAMVAGLIVPTSGEVRWRGVECRPLAPRPWLGAWVGQPGFYAHLSGVSHLRLTLQMRGMSVTRSDAFRALRAAGLDKKRAKGRVGTYSTGMLQRLAYAFATAMDPNVIVLDEPTSGLDPEGIRDVLDDLLRRAQEGAAILISSHRLGELAAVCDEFCLIVEGETRALDPRPSAKGLRIELEDMMTARNAASALGDLGAVRLGRSVFLPETDTRALTRILDKTGISTVSTVQDTPTLEESFFLATGNVRSHVPEES